MRTIKNILLITVPTLIILFIILELFFRFGIKANEFPMHYYDTIDNVYKFDTNYRRDGEWAVGKFAEERGVWHINDEGWNDDVEYPRDRISEKKLIAMYGDSQLEAFMAGIDGNVAHYLREEIGSEYDVFRFGKSDAPYTQYLQMKRYSNKYWDPDVLIFLIMHNDFYHSQRDLSFKPHFMQFEKVDGAIKEIEPKPISHSFIYRLIIKANYYSAFLRYLFYNVRVTKTLAHTSLFQKIQAGDTKKEEFSGNIKVDDATRNKELYPEYFEYFVRKIKEENQGKRIIFVMDGIRHLIHENKHPKESPIYWMHEMVGDICNKYNVEFVDLNHAFYNDFQKNKKEFNPKVDGHWSKYGNKIAAYALLDQIRSKKPTNDTLPIQIRNTRPIKELENGRTSN